MGFVIHGTSLYMYQEKYLSESLSIPENVTQIQSNAFFCCKMTSVYIPDSVTSVKYCAFNRCPNLVNVSAPAKLNLSGAFQDCNPALNITLRGLGKNQSTTKKATESNDAGARLPETDYKELFLDIMYIKELSEKEKVLERISDDDVKIPVAVYLFKEYKSAKAKTYISQNAKAVMLHLVEKGDMESVAEILPIVK